MSENLFDLGSGNPTPSAEVKSAENDESKFYGEQGASERQKAFDMFQKKFNQDLAQDGDTHKLRQDFAPIILTITVMWMIFILILIIGVGNKDLELSDTVLVTLITTTTANVFGFMYVVVNYYFPKNTDKKEPK